MLVVFFCTCAFEPNRLLSFFMKGGKSKLRESQSMDGGSSLGVVQPFLLQDLGQILPPAEDESLADHVEPGSDEEARLGRQHLLQLGRGDVSHRADLVGVHFQFHIFLDEEDVVDLVFPPLPIRGRFVNDASEEV